ncbi:MAG TPA: hypothetical protein VE173_16475 [Longimicrobiales bacterium]|nr:hypothetical protein [Longimicrobiales bacterium]
MRQDPHVDAGPEAMAVWHRAARTIERTECTVRRAGARVRALDARLQAALESTTDAELRTALQAVRDDLRPVVLGLVGDVRDPGHVNLSGRINWLTIQVGNYPGPPTAAQTEWIDRYSRSAGDLVARLDEVVGGSLAELNGRLRAAGMTGIEEAPGG